MKIIVQVKQKQWRNSRGHWGRVPLPDAVQRENPPYRPGKRRGSEKETKKGKGDERKERKERKGEKEGERRRKEGKEERERKEMT